MLILKNPRRGRREKCVTHDMRNTPEYKVWSGMKGRCCNPRSREYPRYGARGIEVCNRWRDSFSAFYEDMGSRPGPQYSIDRIDNDGNYEPGNCRWATTIEQSNNRRSSTFLEHDGKRMTIRQWERALGFRKDAICERIGAGWSASDALTIPFGPVIRRNGLPTLPCIDCGTTGGFQRRGRSYPERCKGRCHSCEVRYRRNRQKKTAIAAVTVRPTLMGQTEPACGACAAETTDRYGPEAVC